MATNIEADLDAYLAEPVSSDEPAGLDDYLNDKPKSRKDQIIESHLKPKINSAESSFAENYPKAFRFYTGARGTLDSAAQAIEKVLPEGSLSGADKALYNATGGVLGSENTVSQDIALRRQKASELDSDGGMDWIQAAGSVADPVAWAAGSKIYQGAEGALRAAPSLVKSIAPSAITGAAVVPLSNPVTDENKNYLEEKAKQSLIGAAAGAVPASLIKGASSVISPAASRNAGLIALKEGGVKPTIGQAMGGAFNTAEEKLQVVPFFGDMISRARGMARDDFNKMVINDVVAPVGGKIDKIGHEGIAEAGDLISKHYDDALALTKGVKFDKEFADSLSTLKEGTVGMLPDEEAVFNKVLSDLGSKVSPAGGMEPKTFKMIDGRIGKAATTYAGTELGGSLRELQSMLRSQLERSNPEQASKLQSANESWAKLVRLEAAGKSASSKEGVFTPAQLINAVKGADKSVRKRAVARGEALMQDTATAGQNILGNKYPDSGTAGRILAAGGAGAGMVANLPTTLAVGAGLGAASSLYTRPIQNMLVKAFTDRPDIAPEIAAKVNMLSSPELARLSSVLSSSGE